VIGGGVNGAGVARDAVLRGIDTVLLEKGDFTRGTSSASTKLAHGGLRYLEHFEFGLVFEALRERKTLLEIAPHLVEPQQFLFPVYDKSRVSSWELKAGLVLYDLLSIGRSIGHHRFLDRTRVRDIFLELSHNNLQTAALYYDCQMDDARIVIENVMDADVLGADVANYCEVTNVEVSDANSLISVTVHDHLRDHQFTVRARKVVNATGPWTDRVSRHWESKSGGRVLPTKGVHLVLPPLETDVAGFFPSIHGDERLFFSIPWRGHTLLGTTDTEFNGDPDHLTVDERDREYLLSNLNHYLEDQQYEKKDILTEFAGLRPLYDTSSDETDESSVSRDHEIIDHGNQIYSIVGGKYTTYRAMAEDALDTMEAPGVCSTDRRPLPGGWINSGQKNQLRRELTERYQLPEEVLHQLLSRYGRKTPQVLRTQSLFDDAFEPVDASPSPIKAQVYHAVINEWARKPKDYIRRRSDLFIQRNPPEDTIRILMNRAMDYIGFDSRNGTTASS